MLQAAHMKVLLLHPADLPDRGEWYTGVARQEWDLVVDLGFASPCTYEEWGRTLQTRVLSIYQCDRQTEGHRWIGRVLERGRGRVVDRMGLDWWEIVGAAHYKDVYGLYLLEGMRAEIPSDQVELAATRPHPFARMLAQMLGCPVRYFQSSRFGVARRARRVLHSAWRLRPAQIAEIAFDKWDPTYRARRYVSKPAGLSEPVVLLPSAYSNVTRTALAYATQLPDRNFLLATTRRNAIPHHLPRNVSSVSLAAYAPPRTADETEIADLTRKYEALQRAMQKEAKEFHLAATLGAWNHFPLHIARGIQLRDAWKSLLEYEPVKGVLCGDDLNYYTRLPLLLASGSNLNAVYCTHGALDGGLLFKKTQAAAYLVKGEMERDYLKRAQSIEPEKVYIGAPGVKPDERGGSREAIVFFSQPYESEGGRPDAVYRELLPRLCATAMRCDRKVIVKLHPFESLRERKALAMSVLPGNLRGHVEFVIGIPPEGVMRRAWCGVAVDSSVAVECALKKIPFFLCGWLDFMGAGYVQHFARYGVGLVLNSPDQVANIPAMVSTYRPDPTALDRLWHEADISRLDEIMFGTRQPRLHPCAC